MSDLTDDEIKSIERSLGRVAVSKSETCRMLAELVRRRAQADALRALRADWREHGDSLETVLADIDRLLGPGIPVAERDNA